MYPRPKHWLAQLCATLVAAVVWSCGSRARIVGADPFEDCGRVELVGIDGSFLPNERDALERGMHAWENDTAHAVCFRVVPWRDAKLHIFRIADRHELLTIAKWKRWQETVGLHDGSNTIYIVEDDPNRHEARRGSLAAHELGHYLGLGHRKEPVLASVMNEWLQDQAPLADGDHIPACDVRAYCAENGCAKRLPKAP